MIRRPPASVTGISPCVLPVLPVVFLSGALIGLVGGVILGESRC